MSSSQNQSPESIQRITASAFAPTFEIRPTKVRWESSRFNEAGVLEITGKPVGELRTPELGAKVVCSINGTRVGAANVDEARRTGEQQIFVRAFDAVRPLKQTTLSKAFTDTSVTAVAREAFNEAEVEFSIAEQFDRESELREDLQENLPEGTDEGGSKRSPLLVNKSYDQVSCAKVIAECARRLDGVWFVDETNTVQLQPTPDSKTVEPRYVLDFDGGSQKAPYTKVVVTGGQTKGSSGSMLSKKPVQATAGDPNAAPRETREYENRTIRSQKTAKNVARSLLKEYRKQAAYGTATFVGEENIRTLDEIQMPDNDYFGGRSFLVSSVVHGVNADIQTEGSSSTDGFMTKVQLGGVLNN